MTIDIKCPLCKKDTDYNLKYNEDYCEHCNKEITFAEMYLGTPEDKDVTINFNRPYNVEKRDLQSYINFGVISLYFGKVCLKSFKDREHIEALKINKERN